MNLDQALRRLLQSEGGYVDHPSDPGGATNHGITEKTARMNGYQGHMRDLPLSVATEIYRKQYWGMIKAEQLPEALRFHVFDAAVNSGNVQAIRWLQRCAGVKEDGIIGAETIKAASAVSPVQYSVARLRFMTSLHTWGQFGKGWARRICDNLELVE